MGISAIYCKMPITNITIIDTNTIHSNIDYMTHYFLHVVMRTKVWKQSSRHQSDQNYRRLVRATRTI